MVLVAGGWEVISRWCGQWVGGTYGVGTYKGVVSIGGNAVQRHCRYWLATSCGSKVVFVTSYT